MLCVASLAQIFNHPRLKKFLHHRGSYTCDTYLGMFGAKTQKPVRLVASDPCVGRLWRCATVRLFVLLAHTHQDIARDLSSTCHRVALELGRKLDRSRFAPSDSTVEYRSKGGERRFRGNGSKLQSTQTYPPKFGRADA